MLTVLPHPAPTREKLGRALKDVRPGYITRGMIRVAVFLSAGALSCCRFSHPQCAIQAKAL